MLTIEYGKNGISCSDFDAKKEADEIIFQKNHGMVYVLVSSEMIINQFRIYILEEKLDIDEFEFKYGDDTFKMTHSGLFTKHPDGFLDANLKQCERILDLRLEKCR